MRRILEFSPASVLASLMITFLIAGVAWAGYTGPNRTTTKTVRDPENDEWWCSKSGYGTCTWQNPSNPCSGSPPSTSAQASCFPPPADKCGCDRAYKEVEVDGDPATVSGSLSCTQFGDNGWCIGEASIDLSAEEPLGGEVIELIEGSVGVLCDPADASSVSCSWSAGGDGNFTVEYWAVSSYGDTSEKGTSAWKLDTQPPSAGIVLSGGESGSGGWYSGGTVIASVSGSDDTSGIASEAVSLDGGANQPSVSIAEDGTYVVEGQVLDQAGHAASDSTVVSYDGTAPSLGSSLSGTEGGGGWYRSAVTATASGSDNLSGIDRLQVRVDGGGWDDESAEISNDGSHEVDFRAVDVAGNISEESFTVGIDRTPPSLDTSIDGNEGRNGWFTSKVEIGASGSDNLSGLDSLSIRVDGGSWRGDSVELSGDGSHEIQVRAVDVAGNSSEKSLSVKIDRTPPSVDFTVSGAEGRGGWYISAVDIHLSGADGTSGLGNLDVQVDGGGWQESPLRISEDGSHDLSFRAVDVAGNSSQGNLAIKIDSTPPESRFLTPEEGSEQWVSGVVDLAGLSGDATSGLDRLEFSLDGGSHWQSLEAADGEWSFSWDTTDVPSGTYVVLVRGQDVAGNMESTARVTLLVDHDPPIIDIPDSWQLGDPAPLIARDEGIGLAMVEINISQGDTQILVMEYPPESVPETIEWKGSLPDGSEASPGEYSVTAVAADLLGHRGSDAGIIINQPQSKPILDLILEPIEKAAGPHEGTGDAADLEVQRNGMMERSQLAAARSIKGIWLWPTLGWVGLLGTLAFAKLSDPRHRALGNLRDDIEQIRRLDV